MYFCLTFADNVMLNIHTLDNNNMTKFSKTKHCAQCNKKDSIFNLLNNSELELINENRLEVNYNTDEIIFKQGTTLTHFLSLNTGLAKIYVEGYNKRNLILGFLKPGEFLCGPGAFTDKRHHYCISALAPSSACLIDIDVMYKVFEQNNTFALAYINHLSKQKIYEIENIVNLTQKQMHGRIANALLYLHTEIYKREDSVVSISRQDLAEFTGMNKDSAGRILKEFYAGKIIDINKNEIQILNIHLLKQIALFG